MRKQHYPAPREVVSFDEWLVLKFGQPVPKYVWQYDWDEPEDHFETRATFAEYVVWTWEDPIETLVERFSISQIGAALWKEHHVYVDTSLPFELRMQAWRALPTLFLKLFDKQCSPTLGHLSESVPSTENLDSACYMWWDICPYYGGRSDLTKSDHDEFFGVIEACLQCKNPAVQESALHGLGHAEIYKETRYIVHQMIDLFLSKNWASRKELIRYAKQARKGRIL